MCWVLVLNTVEEVLEAGRVLDGRVVQHLYREGSNVTVQHLVQRGDDEILLKLWDGPARKMLRNCKTSFWC